MLGLSTGLSCITGEVSFTIKKASEECNRIHKTNNEPCELLGPHRTGILQPRDVPYFLQYHGLSSLDRVEAQAVPGSEVVPPWPDGGEDRAPPLRVGRGLLPE